MSGQTSRVVVGQRFVGNGLAGDRADGPGLPPTPEGLSTFGIIADLAGEAFVAKDRVDQTVVGRQRAAVAPAPDRNLPSIFTTSYLGPKLNSQPTTITIINTTTYPRQENNIAFVHIKEA